MKQLFILLIFISYLGKSQGVYNNGANIVFNGASQMYIDNVTNGNYFTTGTGSITASSSSTITLLKNWINNSSNNGFATPDGGGVVLAGNAQSVSGSSATAFYNLTLAGNGVKTLAVNQTTVGGQTTFTGVLAVGSSTLDLNSNRINITNSAVGAITSAAAGYIISETNATLNPSIIRWYTKGTTGAHIYPFGVAGSKIPFTFNVTTAMGANDYIEVSTRATATDNNQPWAAASNLGGAVSHMYSPNGAYADGSDEVVIDRWWDVTNSSPVTANMTFSYRGVENTLLGAYKLGIIGPQYWDGTGWQYNNLIMGSGAMAVTTGVGAVSISGVTSFCPWVLSAQNSPLPVELINFDANCVNNNVILEWCTASEKNNSFFSIEQSTDGTNFTTVGKVFGNGTTTQKNCYTYLATSISAITYFKLTTVDENGEKTKSKTISIEACNNNTDNIIIANDGSHDVGVIVNSLFDQKLEFQIYNALGQLLEIKNIDALKGYNNLRVDLQNIANGIYYISVYNGTKKMVSKKILVSDINQ